MSGPWTMVVDSATSGETADDVVAALAPVVGAAAAVSTIVAVAADTGPERFAVLTRAVELAGLPAPTWVPDAVACAGTIVAAGVPGCPHLIVDARTGEVGIWGIRPSASGGRIGTVTPLDVGAGLEDLLLGILRAKLGASTGHDLAPTPALGDDLGGAARRLVDDRTGRGRILVGVGDSEVAIESRELAEALAHAARREIVETWGHHARDAPAVLVADPDHGFTAHLRTALNAVMAPVGSVATLRGATELAGARSVPAPRRPSDDARTTVRMEVSRPRRRPAHDRPPWVVPTLSALVVTALVSSGVVVLAETAWPEQPGSAVVQPAGVHPPGVPPVTALSR